MSSVDFRLGEWFKHVDKNAKDVKSKKQMTKPEPGGNGSTGVPIASRQRVSPAIVSTVESVGVEAERRVADTARGAVATAAPAPPDAVAETPIPDVEDFISIHPEVRVPRMAPPQPAHTPDADELLRKIEGTGEPRPIRKSETPRNTASSISAPRAPAPKPKIIDELMPAPVSEAEEKPSVSPTRRPAKQRAVEVAPDISDSWERLPHHLQVLFGARSEEVTQNSYKAFKETRSQLIERLLDPSLSLEETARILNVCPTTVRRYTNKGVLKHQRTAGNQRRFKLSDVLVFLESSGRSTKSVFAE